MNIHRYPHTIENGAGERLTFVRRIKAPSATGSRSRTSSNPAADPRCTPTATRRRSSRSSRGESATSGPESQPPRFAGPGETVVFEPGEMHRFWNAGEEDLLGTGYIQPADNVEYFLTAIFESQRKNGGRRPDLFEAAFLSRRYRSEFWMAGIPTLVQRFVFPLVVTVGRLLGRHRRYAGAPEPVRW
jgi:hypothetical protein